MWEGKEKFNPLPGLKRVGHHDDVIPPRSQCAAALTRVHRRLASVRPEPRSKATVGCCLSIHSHWLNSRFTHTYHAKARSSSSASIGNRQEISASSLKAVTCMSTLFWQLGTLREPVSIGQFMDGTASLFRQNDIFFTRFRYLHMLRA